MQLSLDVRLHEDCEFMRTVLSKALVFAACVALVIRAHADSDVPRLPKEQEAALRARVGSLYEAWSGERWRAMFRLLLPGDQECWRVKELAEEFGGESGERPVAWQILEVRADPESPHRKEPSDCSKKTWRIDAVAWVRMTATIEEADGSRESRDDFENAWLLIDGKWYWSPSEE